VTTAGWLMLAVSWGAIGSLAAYCLYRTLRTSPLQRDDPRDDEAP
jgi:hypothetical protein